MASITFSKLPFFFLFLTSLFSTSITSSPILPHKKRNLLNDFPRQEGGVFSVLGIAGLNDQNNTVHPRLELRELEKDTLQWNIFLLGLQRFQNVSQDDKLSYFQIAGIHGRPWISWDGVEGDANDKSQHQGYCQHSSILFPTWHRPYLALFEEVLYLNARQVILEWPNGTFKDTHLAVLPSLRLPFWDWAAVPPIGEGSMPWSIQRPTIPVTLPSGPTTIPNPLFSYHFEPIPTWQSPDSTRWANWNQTMRHPTSLKSDATSQNGVVANTLDRNRLSMQNRVYGLLALKKEYAPMSSKIMPGDSLESIHGTIHDTVGGDGNMLWLQYSSFDPVFWFHHANVDRLIAIWQEVNRDSWVNTSTNHEPSFTFAPDTPVDAQTPLKPFHKSDNGSFWTSVDVRHWQTFGYTYRAVTDLTETDTIVSRVNALYGPNAQTLFAPPTPASSKRSTAIAGAPSFDNRRQYTANIKLHDLSFDGSLKFYFFLDEPLTKDVEQWVDERGFVGVTSVLANNARGAQSGSEINTMVPLTAVLEAKVRMAELRSLWEEDVDGFLSERLRWRIVKAGGGLVTKKETAEIQLSVSWQEVEPAKSTLEFPSLKGELQALRVASAEEMAVGKFC
ncbi:Di-copper centre-containing protein [Byssothecium circinans]|uniref:tyrosinase n=1 Tax=Byssothecium circinans TaxID=147558 RepID=A0A6A5UQF6_9PLEO|nr:Di-copper centre-containing protein [Byssothecium circinans]